VPVGRGDRSLFKDAGDLDSLFLTRNQIAHEMDMTPAGAEGNGKRTRRERAIQRCILICVTQGSTIASEC
jgi:hypothetical protein